MTAEQESASDHQQAARQREQIAQQAQTFAQALVRSFRYSKGKPLAQARYLVWLKYERQVDLLAFDGPQLMADAHIHDSVLAAFKRQHARLAEQWDWNPLDAIVAAEIRAVLHVARRLEGEGYRGKDLLQEGSA